MAKNKDKIPRLELTKESLIEILNASRTLCTYCIDRKCKRCKVTSLMAEVHREAASKNIHAFTDYTVTFAVQGHLNLDNDMIGDIECNGTTESTDCNGDIFYEIKDGRLSLHVYTTTPQDAYEDALLLSGAVDTGKLIVDDCRLLHISDGVNYWYLEDLCS